MKLRSRVSEDPFDGLTAEDIRRIRGGAAASRMRGDAVPVLRGTTREVPKSHQPEARKRGRRT